MSKQQALLDQARTALTQGDALQAITLYHAASEQDPDNPLIFLGLGMAYCQRKEITQALSAFGKTLGLEANNPDIAFAIADALHRAEQIQLAEQVYHNILQNCPEHLPSAHNLGSLLYSEERFAEAIEQYRLSLLFHPHSPSLHRDLSQALIANQELAAGIEILEATCRQLETDSDDEELRLTRFALALAYLRNEDWTRGWPLYEARWTKQELSEQDQRWGARWDGDSLTGKHLLIIAEQGYGDSLMFARYIPPLAQEAGAITCIVPEALHTALAGAFAPWLNVQICSLTNIKTQHNYFTTMGSLALHANLPERRQPLSTPPPPLPLQPENNTVEVQLTPPCIGLVWRGQSRYSANKRRSISLQKLLLSLPFSDFTYASLQIDSTDEEKKLLANFGIHDLSGKIKDFQDTVNLVSQLAGILCVDTSIAHLAGNLNQPFLLLQRGEGEWRWGKNQNGEKWYQTCCSHKASSLLKRDLLRQTMLTSFESPKLYSVASSISSLQ